MEMAPFFAADWLNTERPLVLADFRGRVLAVEVFRMLCPGCVLHGLPQAQRLAQAFDARDLAVIGLHSVFEHHDGNSRETLAAFLHEWRIRFPVAIDAPGEGPMPRTMAAWALQGTPSLVLLDRRSAMRARHFGQVADLALGAEVMAMIGETAER
ncbi:MAG TPA: TlpA family protein disulfide reductase [Amaricoccus sp.]|uniref:TlpA family protein disulfide reductase n=1 Tax=Amaricoccus sp. TaxID=1872485 RepID=UPI002C33265C|nr:TlpA family protein disulfide reductase [Amaricoccus sp.]HMQ95166.1 TlpA family protein disulfide reductase [Amaricoccus sp.]HMR51313.1 TlpA family protein disulfide reductase [Amaricoccus sp.]HMR61348.1 TlpA family protein disulfide reductase [Amaricoccus sp.]HMT98243.1 TlpA family protein disulfide reductase [Amaricoccus sp.]